MDITIASLGIKHLLMPATLFTTYIIIVGPSLGFIISLFLKERKDV